MDITLKVRIPNWVTCSLTPSLRQPRRYSNLSQKPFFKDVTSLDSIKQILLKFAKNG